jgi:hypothetical protein
VIGRGFSKRAVPGRLVGILAAGVAPWIICISTTNSLFLTNQADLDYDLRIYAPFVYAFLILLTLGTVLFVAGRSSRYWPGLWAFHLAGLGFLIFIATSTRGTIGEHQTLWLVALVVGIAGLVFLLRHRSPSRVAPFLAAFAVMLVANVAYDFLTRFEFSVPDRLTGSEGDAESEERSGSIVHSSGKATAKGASPGLGPNIYHFVLDGYQGDLFALTLEDNQVLRTEFSGFTVFPKTVTPSGRTRVSIPSVFAGRAWDNTQSVAEFTAEAMASPASVLHTLKANGYATAAYLHSRFPFEPNLFDQVYFHHNAARHRGLGDNAFRDLWIFRFLPRIVSNRAVDEKTRIDIIHRSLPSAYYAVVSYDAFLGFLAREHDLPASGRYTFVHLLLPHHPYVLNSDCDYRKAVRPLEQFRCATRVVVSLVQLLKELGQFRESLIIVQGDHGLNLARREDDDLIEISFDAEGIGWNAPRSRTLLMIKPSGITDEDDLIVSDSETTLLDIAPSLYRSIGIEPPKELEGSSLVPSISFSGPRTRYYSYYVSDYEDELYRFIAEGDSLRFDRIARPPGFYTKLPTVPADQLVEAEAGFIMAAKHTVVETGHAGASGRHVLLGSIFLKVHVEKSGAYRLRTRVICKETGEGAIRIRMDEGTYREWTLNPCRKWEWQTTPFEWPLERGVHILTLRQQGRVYLDQIELKRTS